MSAGEGGRFTVDKLRCARNYHLNVVVRIRSVDANGDKRASVDKNMQLDHSCLVLNQEGILRLDPQGQLCHRFAVGVHLHFTVSFSDAKVAI